jgi:hypothetical protein
VDDTRWRQDEDVEIQHRPASSTTVTPSNFDVRVGLVDENDTVLAVEIGVRRLQESHYHLLLVPLVDGHSQRRNSWTTPSSFRTLYDVTSPSRKSTDTTTPWLS